MTLVVFGFTYLGTATIFGLVHAVDERAWTKHPPGPPMTLGNMRELGVRGLAIFCLNHACRHQTVISVDDYADDIEVPSFRLRMKCSWPERGCKQGGKLYMMQDSANEKASQNFQDQFDIDYSPAG